MNKILQRITSLQDSEKIRSTQLRKYCVTVSHIADLTDKDLRWLAEHLGHNLDIHREYYTLRESTWSCQKYLRLLHWMKVMLST